MSPKPSAAEGFALVSEVVKNRHLQAFCRSFVASSQIFSLIVFGLA
ncbi:hypothetical protein SynBIOSE41_02149 [Synechococcus sp. BIOS-E4-1]|nr:hypothetical protein SynBIOSE41_02149 [Synechococcus sp. BIOS-E4-1]